MIREERPGIIAGFADEADASAALERSGVKASSTVFGPVVMVEIAPSDVARWYRSGPHAGQLSELALRYPSRPALPLTVLEL